MRNQRALAATCAAIAVLGLAAPVAVADGMGNGNGTTVVGVSPNTGVFNGNGNFNGNFNNGNGNFYGNGNFNGNGNYNGNGNFNNNGNFGNGNGNFGNGNGNRGNENFGNGNGNGHGNDNFGNGNGNGNGNGRGNDNFGHGNGNGNFGNGNGNGNGGHGGGGNDGNLRNIVVTPSVLPAGGRLTIRVEGCRGGTVSSRAFRAARLEGNGNNSRVTVTIDRNARPGRYDITAECGGRSLTRPNAFTVIGGVNGGLGGSSTTGATRADMAIGGGLVASAALGAGAVWLRRRTEKRV
ncbi:hypothetical protein [Streptomyces bauhiniae]|uniref:hypothetical protein n=1 Tax=Streptomyces bauhiniae TaxID=2340725 RepID=UPI0035D59B02